MIFHSYVKSPEGNVSTWLSISPMEPGAPIRRRRGACLRWLGRSWRRAGPGIHGITGVLQATPSEDPRNGPGSGPGPAMVLAKKFMAI